jgi:hypothetical protein
MLRPGNLKLAQKMLGYSRFKTTANVYTHALDEQEREAVIAVEQAIFGESKRTADTHLVAKP